MKKLIKNKQIGGLQVISCSEGIRCEHTPWNLMGNMKKEHKKRLWDIGFWHPYNNTSLTKPIDAAGIAEAAQILEVYYGRITAVCIWWSNPINAWRICLGNPKY